MPLVPRSRTSSFNLVDTAHGLKVDLFVLGNELLDRMQIARRMNVVIPGLADGIWVTSPEDQVLRKLDWYRSTGHESERSAGDIVAILRIHGAALDGTYLDETARQLDLAGLLDERGPRPTSDASRKLEHRAQFARGRMVQLVPPTRTSATSLG